MSGQRHPLEISGLFLKNSHCLYAKSPRIWKPYQLGSNAIYAFLTMTRSRYLQKCLRQGNACRDTAQNILPASNNLQGRDCLDHAGCACVRQPSTDFSGDSLNFQRSLSPWFLPWNLLPTGFFHVLALEEMVKTFPCSPSPWHSEAAFISPLSPLLQLEDLYFLFLIGKQFNSFDHCCHPALNLFQSYPNSFERDLNFPFLYYREWLWTVLK